MEPQALVRKKRLLDLSISIRRKHESLKYGDAKFQLRQEKVFQPLLKNKEEKPKSAAQDLAAAATPTANDQLANFISDSLLSIDDKMYAVKKNKQGQWYFGEHPIHITPTKVTLHGKEYITTPGLISLLTKKKPENYSSSDLANYKEMLQDTSYHLTVGRDAIKFRQGVKYENIIRRCFPSLASAKKRSRKSHSNSFDDNNNNGAADDGGGGEWKANSSLFDDYSSLEPEEKDGKGFVDIAAPLGMRKVIKDGARVARYQYIYWDDPNELVHRLQLLHMSRLAGNTSADNEISSIVEELRERQLIY